jgi:GNAT superfamily N-acetyltransferase
VTVTTGEAPLAEIAETTFRQATTDDLPTCAAIWRASLNDYMLKLNLAEIPDDLAAIIRLYGHLVSTDPERFVLAERLDASGSRQTVGFVSAVVREQLWFLSMLFILPEAQGSGLGRSLLGRVMPKMSGEGAGAGPTALTTCTDSVQPISNALYASLGMVPRMPLFRIVGLPDPRAALPPLPAGIRAIRFDEVDATSGNSEPGGDGLSRAALDDELTALDRQTSGFEHLADHRFIRAEGRIGFLYLGADGGPVGYGYASEAGRVGPVAVRDPALLGPVLSHLVTTVVPRGAFGIWLPGAADDVLPQLLQAGFRIDGFPCLICWERPIADFSRYIPISPGLL